MKKLILLIINLIIVPVFGQVLQLESDTLQHSGGVVTSWNGIPTTGNPIIITTPTGLPAIRLNGTTDKIEKTDNLVGLPSGNNNRTMIVVARYYALSWWAGIAYGTGTDNQAFGITVKYPSGELVLQGWGFNNDLVSTNKVLNSGWSVQTAILSNGKASLFKDGQLLISFDHNYNTVLSKFVIGQEIAGLGYIQMDVAAVLIYDRALTDTERLEVENNLKEKYLESPQIYDTDATQLAIERHGNYSVLLTLYNPQALRVAIQSCYNLGLPNNDPDKWGYLFSTTNSIHTFTNGYVLNAKNQCFYRVVLWPNKYPHIPPIPAPENP